MGAGYYGWFLPKGPVLEVLYPIHRYRFEVPWVPSPLTTCLYIYGYGRASLLGILRMLRF